MVVLLIISALLAVLYVSAAIGAKGALPDSISAMVFLLPRTGQWLWIVWMWSVTFTIAPPLIEAMPDHLRFIAFVTIACLAFVGAMPLVKNKKNTAHYVLSISAGILTQVCVAVLCIGCLVIWMLFLFLMGSLYVQPQGWLAKAVDGKGVTISEILCWVALITCLFISYSKTL